MFYEELQHVFDQFLVYHMKIIRRLQCKSRERESGKRPCIKFVMMVGLK